MEVYSRITSQNQFPQTLLDVQECYKILPDSNSEAYHINYFLYALRQAGISESIINTIMTDISNTHIETKDIDLISKKFGLGFTPYQAVDRPLRPGNFKVEKIGEKKDSYIICDRKCSNLIPLIIFKNHWMLYDEGIEYNSKIYNTYRTLEVLIRDKNLKPMTMKDKLLLKSKREVYLKTPIEIKLSEYNPTLFEFKQYTHKNQSKTTTDNVFYGDYHKPYLFYIKKCDADFFKTFCGRDCLKQLMNYLFDNFTSSIDILHNLAYNSRLVRYKCNVEEAHEKCKYIFA